MFAKYNMPFSLLNLVFIYKNLITFEKVEVTLCYFCQNSQECMMMTDKL